MQTARFFLFLLVVSALTFSWGCNRDDGPVVFDPNDTVRVDTTVLGFEGFISNDFRTLEQTEAPSDFQLKDSLTLVLKDLPDTSFSQYHSVITNVATGAYLQVSIGNLHFIGTNEPSGQAFLDYFDEPVPRFGYEGPFVDTVGLDTLGNPILDTFQIVVPGIEVRYNNGGLNTWSSRFGVQPITSSFNLTNIRKVQTERGVEIVEFIAFFDCALTDTLSNTVVNVSNGKFTGYFRNNFE